jgi:heptosyltransferase-2
MNRTDFGPKILILVPNWLGDVVMCTPALRALHQRFPEARLSVAGQSAPCQLLEGLPGLDHFIPIPKRHGLLDTFRLARQLAPYGRDGCVIFPHSFRAALLARLSGASRRIGYDRGSRGFLLTDRVAPYRENGDITPIYMAREYLDLLDALGCVDDDAGLELHAPPDEVNAVQQLRKGDGPLIALAPGAAFGPSKRWPAERYAAVADALTEQADATCMLITGPGEEDTRQAVMDAARHPLVACYEDEPSIARLKAAIAGADLLVCNDSGPRHIGVAFKKPVVCIMGPTSPRYTDSPWETGRLLRVDVDCGPCQKPTCTTDHRCMTQITPDTVIAAALEHL